VAALSHIENQTHVIRVSTSQLQVGKSVRVLTSRNWMNEHTQEFIRRHGGRSHADQPAVRIHSRNDCWKSFGPPILIAVVASGTCNCVVGGWHKNALVIARDVSVSFHSFSSVFSPKMPHFRNKVL